LKVPALHEVIAGLKIDKMRGQKIVTLLLRDKVWSKFQKSWFFIAAAGRMRGSWQLTNKSQPSTWKFKELTG